MCPVYIYIYMKCFILSPSPFVLIGRYLCSTRALTCTHTPTQVVADWRALVAVEYILTILIYTHVKTIPFCFLYILAQSSVPTRWFRVENSLFFFSFQLLFSNTTREFIFRYIYILRLRIGHHRFLGRGMRNEF